MIRIFVLAVLVFLVILSCKAKIDRSALLPKQSYVYDTADFTVIPFTNNYWVFNDASPAGLSAGEIVKVESILAGCITGYNLRELRRLDSVMSDFSGISSEEKDALVKTHFIDLANYKRQYFPIINSKGEKEVWVNCFCSGSWHFSEWRRQIVEVSDGGNCFFNVIINLTRRTYRDLRVNGF
jgi:hypothetical protein